MNSGQRQKLLANLLGALDARQRRHSESHCRLAAISEPMRKQFKCLLWENKSDLLDQNRLRLLKAVHRHNLRCPIDEWISCGCHLARLRGLAVPFNGGSSEKLVEYVKCRAFCNTSNDGLIADVNHDHKQTFATTTDDTLIFVNAAGGMWAIALIPDSFLGREVVEAVQSDKLSGMSVTYSRETMMTVLTCRCRMLYHADLLGVSLTGTPAFQQTLGKIILEPAASFAEENKSELPNNQHQPVCAQV
ncbi:MAG TPA: HK97 family phage prohead protease [Thermoguttaceae bacterium]